MVFLNTLWLMYLKYFGQNTCCIFRILTTKFKIQYKQSWTTTTRPVQRNVTMSHEVQSTLLHKTLFGSGYCSVRRKCSVRNIHLAAAGWKNDWLLFRHPDE